ncbi:MAG: superoxide dismutase family protein, partial [Nevskiales bacterium]
MQKRFQSLRIVALGACGTLAAALAGRSVAGGLAAHAVMAPASGNQVSGTVIIRPNSGGVHLDVKLAGLSPGAHEFHVHEVGDCSAADASSAKGHFHPTGQPHGSHGGDLPDLTADAGGVA